MGYTLNMAAQLLAVTTNPLDAGAVVRAVSAEPTGARDRRTAPPPSAGAISSFLGVVRNENRGRRVLRLEYEAYEPLALRVFQQVANEVGERWPRARLAVHHRLGTLDIGETSVAIAAAAPHRAEAFAACRYAIERVKQIAPIWKHEFFEGGDVWIEGATADPDDEAARQDAYRRACV